MATLADAYQASIGFAEDAKTTPLRAVNNMFHNSVNATLWNVSRYVSDILNPGFEWVKSVWNVWRSLFKREFKNAGLAWAWAVTQFGTAFKNAGVWIPSTIRNLYREWGQNNLQLFQNGTTMWIPYVGPAVKKILDGVTAVWWAPLALVDKVATKIDVPFNYVNAKTAVNDVKVTWVNARRDAVSEPSLNAWNLNYQLRA